MAEREDPREFRPVRESSVWTAVILVVVLLWRPTGIFKGASS